MQNLELSQYSIAVIDELRGCDATIDSWINQMELSSAPQIQSTVQLSLPAFTFEEALTDDNLPSCNASPVSVKNQSSFNMNFCVSNMDSITPQAFEFGDNLQTSFLNYSFADIEKKPLVPAAPKVSKLAERLRLMCPEDLAKELETLEEESKKWEAMSAADRRKKRNFKQFLTMRRLRKDLRAELELQLKSQPENQLLKDILERLVSIKEAVVGSEAKKGEPKGKKMGSVEQFSAQGANRPIQAAMDPQSIILTLRAFIRP